MKTRQLIHQTGLGAVILLTLQSALSQEIPDSTKNPPSSLLQQKPLPTAVASSSVVESTNSTGPARYVSPWLADVIKLAKAGLDQNVLLTFIDSAGTFNLDADRIIELSQAGVSADVISTMLQHDFELTSGLRPVPSGPSGSAAGLQLTFVPGKTPADAPANPSGNEAPNALTSEPGPGIVAEDTEVPPGSSVPIPTASVPVRPVPSPPMVFPVRQPYPVQISEPIIVIRAESRTPNLVVIQY